MWSPFHDDRVSSARSTSGTLTLTTISFSKSRPALKSRYSCVGRAKQYLHAWLQPRYGLTVHSNGTRDAGGTRLIADLVRISWKRVSSASGALKRRTTTSSEKPGRRGSWSALTLCESQRTNVCSHTVTTERNRAVGAATRRARAA